MAEIFRCKMRLNACQSNPIGDFAAARFTGVWEGSPAKQLASPNAIFGRWTPYAEFNANLVDPAVIGRLMPGKTYLFLIVEAPSQP